MSEQSRLFGDSDLLWRSASSSLLLEECFKLFFDCLSLQVESNMILRNAGTNDTSTWRHFPEGSNPHKYRRENLKTRHFYLNISIKDTFEVRSLCQQQPLKQINSCIVYSGFVWRWNLGASGSRSEIPGKFWNVVVKKDGEDQMDRSCEKWRSVG